MGRKKKDRETLVFIGENIKKAMKKADLNRETVAEMTGVSVTALDKYISGDRTPSPEFVAKFAEITGTNELDYLTADTQNGRIKEKNRTVYEKNRFFVEYLKELGFFSNVQTRKSPDDKPSSGDGLETNYAMHYGMLYSAAVKALAANPDSKASRMILNSSVASMLSESEWISMKSEVDETVKKIVDRHLKRHDEKYDINSMLYSIKTEIGTIQGKNGDTAAVDKICRRVRDYIESYLNPPKYSIEDFMNIETPESFMDESIEVDEKIFE